MMFLDLHLGFGDFLMKQSWLLSINLLIFLGYLLFPGVKSCDQLYITLPTKVLSTVKLGFQ